MRYGFYKENGKVKYKPLPKHILNKREKKMKKDKCKQIEFEPIKNEELVQPLEWGDEDE